MTVVVLNWGTGMVKNFRCLIIGGLLLVLTVWLSCGGVLWAQGPGPKPDPEKRSLRGLKGVIVGVAKEKQLQIDVERRLQKSGISIVTIEELTRLINEGKYHSLPPNLYVFHIVKHIDGYIWDEVIVKLEQDVRLERDRSIGFSVATWKRSLVVIGTRETTSQNVRQRVMDLIDKFINDYWAANP